jgi:hypothetical protein
VRRVRRLERGPYEGEIDALLRALAIAGPDRAKVAVLIEGNRLRNRRQRGVFREYKILQRRARTRQITGNIAAVVFGGQGV